MNCAAPSPSQPGREVSAKTTKDAHGWWIEGCIEDVTGWAIGDPSDAATLYQKLEQVVLPCYYQQRDQFVRIMRHAIALNASHFNTQRMVQEYVLKAYFE